MTHNTPDQTKHKKYPLPHPRNVLQKDVLRIADGFNQIDSDIHDLEQHKVNSAWTELDLSDSSVYDVDKFYPVMIRQGSSRGTGYFEINQGHLGQWRYGIGKNTADPKQYEGALQAKFALQSSGWGISPEYFAPLSIVQKGRCYLLGDYQYDRQSDLCVFWLRGQYVYQVRSSIYPLKALPAATEHEKRDRHPISEGEIKAFPHGVTSVHKDTQYNLSFAAITQVNHEKVQPCYLDALQIKTDKEKLDAALQNCLTKDTALKGNVELDGTLRTRALYVGHYGEDDCRTFWEASDKGLQLATTATYVYQLDAQSGVIDYQHCPTLNGKKLATEEQTQQLVETRLSLLEVGREVDVLAESKKEAYQNTILFNPTPVTHSGLLFSTRYPITEKEPELVLFTIPKAVHDPQHPYTIKMQAGHSAINFNVYKGAVAAANRILNFVNAGSATVPLEQFTEGDILIFTILDMDGHEEFAELKVFGSTAKPQMYLRGIALG
tara:strand:- start:155 stop:1633 length:1479 start_codon:yes stop_codon:yes gene_type:complete